MQSDTQFCLNPWQNTTVLCLFFSVVLNQMIVVGLLVKILVEEDADALFQINFIEDWFTYKNVPI